MGAAAEMRNVLNAHEVHRVGEAAPPLVPSGLPHESQVPQPQEFNVGFPARQVDPMQSFSYETLAQTHAQRLRDDGNSPFTQASFTGATAGQPTIFGSNASTVLAHVKKTTQ